MSTGKYPGVGVLMCDLSGKSASPGTARTASGFAPTVTWQNGGHITDIFNKYLLNKMVGGWMDG